MADHEPNEAERDRLQVVLAAYGADPARWPERDRELASLLTDADLSETLEDARSLDSALARASRPVAPAGAAERLLVRLDGTPNVVVPFARPAPAQPHQQTALPGRLAAITALAASLAFGLYLGATGQTDWLAPQMQAETELDVLDGTLQLFEDHTDP